MAFLIVWCIIQIHIQNSNREYCCQACAMQIGMVAKHEIRVLSVHTSISQLWQNKWKVATVNYLPGSTQMNFHSIIKWIFYYYHLKVTDIHSLVCIMTAYLTQLVHGCHRSANDPEKILKCLGNSRKFIWREEKFKIWRKVLECLNYSIMMLPFPVIKWT